MTRPVADPERRLVLGSLAVSTFGAFAATPATPPTAAVAASPSATTTAAAATWVPAHAAFGAPKYAADFRHFDYADPAARKGGTLYLRNPDRRSSFDKFNPYTLQGNAPAGMGIFMFESLAIISADEPRTMYGLIAEAMRIAPDLSSISFRIDPRARFSNGDPVTAGDVKFSFDTLSGAYVMPSYRSGLAGVRSANVVDTREIRFELAEKTVDTLFQLGGLPVFSAKWGLKPDGSRERFDRIVTEYPLTTGAYTVAVADSGRHIEFVRNRDYWARDLPARRGFFNFDRVVYRYYQDEDVATEAFKAGEFDIAKVYGARVWMRQHVGEKWRSGQIVKQTLPIGTGQGLQSYQWNLRRPLFQDARVRTALELSYDFETTNRYRLYKRANSIFNNSTFAAVGMPSADELTLLEPYRETLPPEVFGPPYRAPRTDTDSGALRRNLLRARALLREAGWAIASDGRLRNAGAASFDFEYLAPGDSNREERLNGWAQNLAKLGIRMTVRNVEFALYDRRLEAFDFDVVTIAGSTFTLPSVADYVSGYGSKAAGEPGSNNLRGLKSAAADHAIDAMNRATTIDAFRTACRALDRIVMWTRAQIPELYSDQELLSYWNRFEKPAVTPLYFSTDLAPDVDPQLPWPITTWWLKSGAPT